MKKTKSIKEEIPPKRSKRSDQMPHVGIGILPDNRGADSLIRCAIVVEALFNAPGADFSYIEKNKVINLLSEDALTRTVMIYWDDYDYDHRTKDSHLKGELITVVAHLQAANEAMNKVQKQTANVINQLIQAKKLPGSPKLDVFAAALQANTALVECCKPLVEGIHGKSKRLRVINLAAAMIEVWEHLAGEKFKSNTRKIEVGTKTSLVKDLYEFQGRGPHFVHVMLQAIDPDITRSMVETSVKALGGDSGRKTNPEGE